LSSCAHVFHSTAKLVISRRRKNENVNKMSKIEKCMCKACKNAIFHCQICKLVGFLLPLSSWLLKLPNNRVGKYKIKKYQFGTKTKESGTNFRYLMTITNSTLVDFDKTNCYNMPVKGKKNQLTYSSLLDDEKSVSSGTLSNNILSLIIECLLEKKSRNKILQQKSQC